MPSLNYLYKTIDKIHELNLNKLHLHLSDDQGFRVEIKKYPKLNTISSFRDETCVEKNFPMPWLPFQKYIGDGKRYGGFYTQDELKKLVKYAKNKGIEIVPEIDIPGHMTAILAAYPEYAAKVSPEKVATYWGIFPFVLSDKNESLDFIKNIFDEVCDIFESEYIHIGGDEVLLENYHGYENMPKKILREIINYLNNKNKKVIVWDEAGELVLNTKNVIMNWRDVNIGLDFVKRGGKVIFCPNEYFYFDYYQHDPANEPMAIGGYLPIEKVVSFDFPGGFRKKYSKNILGLQANLWTEYMPTEEKMDYMLYPRLNTFSEVVNKT
jgi:hexosaminidase